MDLTEVQRRTLETLIRPDEAREAPAGLAGELRARIEGAFEDAPPLGQGPSGPLRLSKERLNDLARCRGLFQSGLLGEREPYEMSFRTAAGTLLHKTVELGVGLREPPDPWTLGERAVSRLREDRRFGPYWESVSSAAQDEILAEAVRGLEMFTASFPPLGPLRTRLAPIAEFPLRAEFAGGKLVVSGAIDLVLNRPHRSMATRLLVDLKSGGAWPEYPEDMRLYALLYTLRFGVPPLRVATVFLVSGEWQAEEVEPETLFHAADRVVEAVAVARELTEEAGETVLNPGPWCGWCPRRTACPAARGRVA